MAFMPYLQLTNYASSLLQLLHIVQYQYVTGTAYR